MESKVAALFAVIIIALFHLPTSEGAEAQAWVKAGYWHHGWGQPVAGMNPTLYTHVISGFAGINSSTCEVSISSNETFFSTFPDIVKQNNTSIITLIGVGCVDNISDLMHTVVANSSNRKAFIDSSITTARHYGYQGIDLCWSPPGNKSDSTYFSNIGILFKEWREAVKSEATNSSQDELLLTAAYWDGSHEFRSAWPADLIASAEANLDWVHLHTFDYLDSNSSKVVAPSAALHEPSDEAYGSIEHDVKTWTEAGLSANKLVLGLHFNGYAWNLTNPSNGRIGASSTGPANGTGILSDWSVQYKTLKQLYKNTYGAQNLYDPTYVVNYCILGSTSFVYDGVETVAHKIHYAKQNGLRGYFSLEISDDSNWELSTAASEYQSYIGKGSKKWKLYVIISAIIVGLFISCLILYYIRIRRTMKSKERLMKSQASAELGVKHVAATGNYRSSNANVLQYRLAIIEAATDNFSDGNKLGQGGYGPVYKGILPDGQEIAVKKLSSTSRQGLTEFENEVTLTAQLQHVNLVRLLGFCADGAELMLIYEYMPNKSLDYYLFDPARRVILDWKKRVAIIEGITQGLLYLQEYSRIPIIHRDIKASNILLDANMRPKISDFGMARIFAGGNQEENTDRIVGTPGYVPPEYINQGKFSTKLDVYSFGILLLQIISGERNFASRGSIATSSPTQTAYEMWIARKGKDILDPTLDDSTASWKLMKCLQIALLCVQENADDRPSMLEVSSMLRNETAEIAVPKRPAFSSKTNSGDNAYKPASLSENMSVDRATITGVHGR